MCRVLAHYVPLRFMSSESVSAWKYTAARIWRKNMYQFFVAPSQITDKTVIIDGGDVNHIKNVLRMKPGEKLQSVTGRTAKNTVAVS